MGQRGKRTPMFNKHSALNIQNHPEAMHPAKWRFAALPMPNELAHAFLMRKGSELTFTRTTTALHPII